MATSTGPSTSKTKQGLRLLSLDGGGIRGLSELVIIEELMERLKWTENLDEVPIPADFFDLIGGTSTGGLIAILLGRLGLSAAKAIEAYEALAGKVFSDKKRGVKDGIFKATNLEEAIKKVVKDTLGPERTDAKMYEEGEGESNKCRTFVCAVGTSDVTHAAGPTLFRSYDVAKNKEYNCTIWEAARATSAAPTIFKRIKIGPLGSGIEYVDAGIGYNNPVKQVIAEAARVFGDDAPIAGILSIGTGQSGSVGLTKPDAFQKLLPTNLINVLKEIATDSGRVAGEMKNRYTKVAELYSRLDVDRGLQSVSLDEWKRLGEVREHTKNYMRLEDISKRVDNVVGVLNGSFSHQTRTARELVGSVQYISPRHEDFSHTESQSYRASVAIDHKTLWINVPRSRVYHFVDRPAVLTSISDWFQNCTSEKIVVLLGMGGSGKTQLALELCRHAEEDLGYMAVIWINASSPVSVMQSYKAVAKKILKHQQDDANSEDVISLVQDTLQEWTHPWLFVFDNYDNPKAFQTSSIRHYIPRGKEGRILFTSRHRDLARLGHQVDVSVMTADESLKVLLQRSPLDDEEKLHGGQIAATLGYHVLALDQAGSYLRAHSVELRNFVSHYHKRKEVILNEIPDEWEYRRTISDEEKETSLKIFTTWELSFEQIIGREEEIRQKEHFLSLAAFFDITAISERYFEAYFNAEKPEWMAIFTSDGRWDGDKLGDVLTEFRKLSLLQKSNVAVAEQVFSLHPVVRDWIQIRKDRESRQQFARESVMTLASYLRGVDRNNLPLETNQETGLHIDSCVRHDKDLLSGSSDKGLNNSPIFASLFAEFYRVQGRYDEAEKLYGRVLINAEENLGAAHPYTLMIMNNLAILYTYQSRYDKAEKLYERVLINSKKAPGVVNLNTLSAMENLANVYLEQRRYDEAEKLFKRVLNVREERMGATHPDTLGVMDNLALLYSGRSQYDEAEKLFKRVLTEEREILGATHPSTLDTMHGLGDTYCEQGRYDEAEKLLEEALTGRKEKLGATHSFTLRTIDNLGDVYCEQGRYDEAEKLLEEALTGRKEKLGFTHPDTLVTMHNLGIMYYRQGRYNEAEKFLEQVLIERKEKRGATHPNTLQAAKYLAMLYRDQGRHDEAESLKQKFNLD